MPMARLGAPTARSRAAGCGSRDPPGSPDETFAAFRITRRSLAPADPPAAAPRRRGRHPRPDAGRRPNRPAPRPGRGHPPSGITAQLLARGTIAHASHVGVAGIKLATRGPVDVATVHVTFQPGGSTGW